MSEPGQLLSVLFWLLAASVEAPLVLSQSTKQIAVVADSWHLDLAAHLYSDGFSFTHEHLSPGPKSGSALRAGGWHRPGLLPAGALSRLVFFWGVGVGRGGQKGLASFWVTSPGPLSAAQQCTHARGC